jgi:hypothetical protein
MVVQIHTGEFYYIGPGGSVIDTPAAHWVAGSTLYFAPASRGCEQHLKAAVNDRIGIEPG